MKHQKTLTKSVEILNAPCRPSKSRKLIVSAETASTEQIQDQVQDQLQEQLQEQLRKSPKQPLIETEHSETEPSETQPSEITMTDSKFIYFPRDVRTSWPATRTNQIVNILYFGSCAIFFLWLSIFNADNSHIYYGRCPIHPGLFLSSIALAFFSITAVSCLFLLRHRSFVSTNNELPPLSRNLLRVLALSLPFPIICFVAPALYAVSDTSQDYYRLPGTQYFAGVPLIPPGPQDQQALDMEINIADRLFDKHDYLNALVHYEKALDNYSSSEHALVRAAECYYSAYPNRLETTIEYATEALNMNSNNTDALLCLALSYNDLERYDEALSTAESLISLEPRLGSGWAALSKAKLGLGLFQGALIAADEHVRLHPNEFDALNDRAQVLKAMGRTREAQADLEKLKTL